MKKISLLVLASCLTQMTFAQFTRYIVRFTDKSGTPYSISTPSNFLTQRAIDRRTRYQLAVDSSDLPITPRYLDSVRLSGNVTVLNVSRWLNQVSIQTNDPAALAKINSFPFVRSAAPIAAKTAITPVNKSMEILTSEPNRVYTAPAAGDVFDYGASNGQVKIHNGQFLHNHGFRGEGMQVAVLDAGFYRYDELPTFDSVLMNNRLLGTWDFVANENSVAEDNSHGMHCFSAIAANMPGSFVGTAPKSSFYLYRTEDVASEYPIEEHNFAVAVERADSLGVDICSTSLGYYIFDNPIFNYSYADMNGHTTISALAASMAAKKGMLMVMAAGNEGNGSWRYLITPSDADSAFAVGAVDSLGNVAGFSSYGPSSDGQIKPSVAAVGWNAIVANSATGLPAYSSGTSFACPNMAGITTCLWQAFPEMNNMTIIAALQQSGTKATNPDDRVGYGIPDAKNAFVRLQRIGYQGSASFSLCKTNIDIRIKGDSSMYIELDRKFPGENSYAPITILPFEPTFETQNLSYTDDLSQFDYPSVQYRYKMHIGTDTSYVLDSVTVNYNSPCTPIPPTENSITISPNPVSENLYLRINRTSTTGIAVVLHNAAGQKVYSQQYQHAAGFQLTTIPMNKLQSGTYFVTVFLDGKKSITKKIIRL